MQEIEVVCRRAGILPARPLPMEEEEDREETPTATPVWAAQ